MYTHCYVLYFNAMEHIQLAQCNEVKNNPVLC